jgi:RHS repeat-associated protein
MKNHKRYCLRTVFDLVLLIILTAAPLPLSADLCHTYVLDMAGASIVIGDSAWTCGATGLGCDTTKHEPSADAPVPTITPCAGVTGEAAAIASTFESFTCQDGWVGLEVVPGSLNIETGGTGCKYTIVSNDCGYWTFYISEPKKKGVVTVTAKVSGDCQNDVSICEYVPDPKHWEVVARIKVEMGDDGGGGCGSGSCGGPGSGGKGKGAGNGDAMVDSLDFKLNLGHYNTQTDAGYLWLHSDVPTTDLSKPGSLELPLSRPALEVLPALDGSIKQIKTPDGLVHVAVVSGYEYQLKFFYESTLQKSGGDYVKDGSGFYKTNANTLPYVTWVVKNPDNSSAYNRLWITEQRDGVSRDFKYTYTVAALRWDLLQPDGHTTNSAWLERDTGDGSGNTTNYWKETTYDSTLVRKSLQKYKWISALNDKVLLLDLEGDGSVTRGTTNTYYSGGAAAGSANMLQRVDKSEGGWEYNVYDSSGRVITNYSAYAGSAPPSAGTAPDPLSLNCKSTEYSYSLSSGVDGIDDDGSSYPHEARRTVVRIAASGALREVSRSYYHRVSDTQIQTEECVNPGATWGTAGNLHSSQSFDGLGRPTSGTTAQGITTSYAYTHPDERYKTVVQSYSASGNGTETTTFTDEFGLPLAITNKVMVSGYAGVVLSSSTYNYKDGGGSYLDPLRRSYDVADLAGRTTQYRYNSCCGLDYTLDPDGIKNYFLQDPLMKWPLGQSRLVEIVSSTEHTIQLTNKLDPAGSVLVTKRVGTDGSPMTLAQYEYDILGRVIHTTNALNGVTTNIYSIDSGRLQQVTLNSDGGTITNNYYRDGRLESSSGTAVSGIKYLYGVEYESSAWREYAKQIKLDATFAESSEWTKTFLDGAGNAYRTVYPDIAAEQSYFNNIGQLVKSMDADEVVTLYKYNTEGELESTAIDVDPGDTTVDGDGNFSIDFDNDRITRIERSVQGAGSGLPDRLRQDTYVWKDGESSGTLVSRAETSTDGLRSWEITYSGSGSTIKSNYTGYGANGARTDVTTGPDGSKRLSAYSYGRRTSLTQKDSGGSQLGQVTYTYEPHGRVAIITDARTGATTNAYNNADQITSVTTPQPSPGVSSQITLTFYNRMLQATNVVQPDGGGVTNEFFTTGLLKKTRGSRTYPVEYTYDYAGRMKTMKTWQDTVGNSGTAVTTWNYDSQRGWLNTKRYADSYGSDYTYTPAARLGTRKWARSSGGNRILTTYGYDAVGDLETVTYNDGVTPGVTHTYDRQGRRATTIHNSMTTTLDYNDAGQVLSEAYSGGVLDDLSVTNDYDSVLRRESLTLLSPDSVILARTEFGYDNASRLQTVSDGINSATHAYLANSPLVSTITLQQNSATRMTTTRVYDNLNRLKTIASALSPGLVVNSAYGCNTANQRTSLTNADGSYWLYQYDALGQVTRGAKYFSDNSIVPGQQFDYTFDDIGNRKTAKTGGDENGANQRTATYTLAANGLNQYDNRTVPGYADVLGVALGGSTVSVNSSTAWRKGEYFRRELSIPNSSSAVWQSVSVGDGTSTASGNLFVPKTSEAYTYDLDGNLTQDGRWDYTWDAENRLARMVSRSSPPSGSEKRLEFVYDHLGRRIGKKVWNNTSGSGSPALEQKFVYDGWNLVGILNSSFQLQSSFVWGLDLSRTLQGAGGIGGLVVVSNATLGAHFASYNGNGNLRALVGADSGTLSAAYEYGPFGELIRQDGAMAKANTFRFSTKYQDDETELLYYGYRYYSASIGRWLTRDPIEEEQGPVSVPERQITSQPEMYLEITNDALEYNDGLNLYEFGRNNPIDRFDVLGLACDCLFPTAWSAPPLSSLPRCWRGNVGEVAYGPPITTSCGPPRVITGPFSWSITCPCKMIKTCTYAVPVTCTHDKNTWIKYYWKLGPKPVKRKGWCLG